MKSFSIVHAEFIAEMYGFIEIYYFGKFFKRFKIYSITFYYISRKIFCIRQFSGLYPVTFLPFKNMSSLIANQVKADTYLISLKNSLLIALLLCHC